MLDQPLSTTNRGPRLRALGVADGLGDRELAERARDDRDAFAALYRRHVHAVHTYAYRASGSKHVAEEVTSATFEKALTAMARFEWRGGGVKAWLLRIAASEVAAYYRRQNRERRPRGQMALRDLAAAGAAATPLDPPAIRGMLAELTPRHREAIGLRYLAGLSTEESARAMGCTTANFAVTLHRAIGALRKVAARHTGGDGHDDQG